VEACEANGVQIMDGTMWIHNPRTHKMKEFLNDKERFGELKNVSFKSFLLLLLVFLLGDFVIFSQLWILCCL
jgi:hypothetical protein